MKSKPVLVWLSPVVSFFGLWMALPWCGLSYGQEVTVLLSGPTQAVPAGSQASIGVHYLNHSTNPVTRAFLPQYPGRLTSAEKVFDVILEPRLSSGPTDVLIPAGGFVRKEYAFTVSASILGSAVLDVPGLGANRVVLDVARPLEKPPELALTSRERLLHVLREGIYTEKDYAPVEFFKEHFFGYEPMYFIAGPNAPEGKFQLSLRYQIVSQEGGLAKKAPFLTGLNFAYTQTSLWDLGQESSPFLDTSYKPELFHLWQGVDGGRWGDWIRLDLQGGLQHESNGNPETSSRLLDVADRVSYYTEDGTGGLRIKTSRSLNIFYLRSTVLLGRTNRLQVAVSPRVWTYVGGLDDNPALPDYRGYGDLRTTVGWANGLQLSALGRLGDDGNRGSLQLDLTYPLMKLLWGSFSAYLHFQYFNGYGESLLLYKHHSEAFRFGFSIYR